MKRWIALPPFLLLLLASCGGPPPRPELDRLYRALADRPEDFDRTCLLGKRILIDPGHGGVFSGAVGAGGVAEKDVNLGVALYLWGLLAEAGAEARLTRSADRDFAAGDREEGLEKDLAARIAMADSFRPHLFLSIHHNAAADTNRSRNRVETYYREGDEASLDAARRIHASLARNLGIDDSSGAVRPGNYAVLRNSRWPAVLGEPSYLSHPPVEDKLALAEKQRLEAEAYFIGLVDYFRRGIPETRIDAPPERVGGTGDLLFTGLARDEEGHAGIDPSSVRVHLDGKPLEARFDPARGTVLAALPPLLPGGRHHIRLHARNRKGNAAAAAERDFTIALPPERSVLSGFRAPGGGTIHLRARLEDGRGLPAGEGERVTVEGGGYPAGGKVREGVLTLTIEPCSLPAPLRLTGESFRIDAHLRAADLDTPRAAILVLDRRGEPAAGTILWTREGPVGTAGPDGWIGLERIPEAGEAGRADLPSQQSIRFPYSGAPIDTIRSKDPPPPLEGVRVLLDPAGKDGIAPLPSASIFLFAARDAEEILRFWGARPSLTREGPLPATEDGRILLARERGADLWLTIDEGEDYEVLHFPGSARGEPLARSVAAEMERVLARPVSVRAAVDRVLRETPCPAIRILFPPAAEGESSGGELLRSAAAAIAEGIRLRLDRSPESRASLLFNGLAAGDEVRLDDRAGFRAPASGPFRIVLPTPGLWTARIRRDGEWETRVIDVPPGEEVQVR